MAAVTAVGESLAITASRNFTLDHLLGVPAGTKAGARGRSRGAETSPASLKRLRPRLMPPVAARAAASRSAPAASHTSRSDRRRPRLPPRAATRTGIAPRRRSRARAAHGRRGSQRRRGGRLGRASRRGACGSSRCSSSTVSPSCPAAVAGADFHSEGSSASAEMFAPAGDRTHAREFPRCVCGLSPGGRRIALHVATTLSLPQSSKARSKAWPP